MIRSAKGHPVPPLFAAVSAAVLLMTLPCRWALFVDHRPAPSYGGDYYERVDMAYGWTASQLDFISAPAYLLAPIAFISSVILCLGAFASRRRRAAAVTSAAAFALCAALVSVDFMAHGRGYPALPWGHVELAEGIYCAALAAYAGLGCSVVSLWMAFTAPNPSSGTGTECMSPPPKGP